MAGKRGQHLKGSVIVSAQRMKKAMAGKNVSQTFKSSKISSDVEKKAKEEFKGFKPKTYKGKQEFKALKGFSDVKKTNQKKTSPKPSTSGKKEASTYKKQTEKIKNQFKNSQTQMRAAHIEKGAGKPVDRSYRGGDFHDTPSHLFPTNRVHDFAERESVLRGHIHNHVKMHTQHIKELENHSRSTHAQYAHHIDAAYKKYGSKWEDAHHQNNTVLHSQLNSIRRLHHHVISNYTGSDAAHNAVEHLENSPIIHDNKAIHKLIHAKIQMHPDRKVRKQLTKRVGHIARVGGIKKKGFFKRLFSVKEDTQINEWHSWNVNYNLGKHKNRNITVLAKHEDEAHSHIKKKYPRSKINSITKGSKLSDDYVNRYLKKEDYQIDEISKKVKWSYAMDAKTEVDKLRDKMYHGIISGKKEPLSKDELRKKTNRTKGLSKVAHDLTKEEHGAGEIGTDKLTKKYKKDTPGEGESIEEYNSRSTHLKPKKTSNQTMIPGGERLKKKINPTSAAERGKKVSDYLLRKGRN